MVDEYDLGSVNDKMKKAGWEGICDGMYIPGEEFSRKIRKYRGSLESKERVREIGLEFLGM